MVEVGTADRQPGRATLAKHRADVAAMFDQVAARYDVTNDVMTMGLMRRWRRDVLRAVDPRAGQRVLDLAAGTGTSSLAFAAAGARVCATDLSLGMLSVGRRRYPGLDFVAGDALSLPFADATFDAVTISYGLRNVEDTGAALAELRRVTRPGGRLVICEVSTPTLPIVKAVYGTIVTAVLPRLAQLVSSDPVAYEYLTESMLAWPDQRSLAAMITDAGWRAVQWRNLTGGLVALHRAWA